nr:glycosyltransferase family 2 protein [Bacilli bacterium]
MKLITFAIPCYNSEKYMSKAIDSLLDYIDDIEIVIINDGSKDNTLKIANNYKSKYPKDIKVIDKENGGHGSGVNAGLKVAKGLYYKVLDSDDWVDNESLNTTINTIKKLKKRNKLVDMIIVNYVYERGDDKKVVNYNKILPKNSIFGWKDVGKFNAGEYLLMHSVLYKTDLLQKSGLKLPEHTFYVDNIFVYYPLPQIKTMYYLDVDFYRYFIGRDDQSVNETNMIKRIDQQLLVTKKMISYFDPFDYKNTNYNLYRYLIHYLDIMMTISTTFLALSNNPDDKHKKDELWNYLKTNNKRLYNKLKHNLSGVTTINKGITKVGYKISRKIYKFN